MLGDRIKQIRQAAGLTQTDFGKRMTPTVTTSAVSSWESSGGVKLENLLQIIDLFGVDGHWLLTGEGSMLRAPPPPPPETWDRKLVLEVLSALERALLNSNCDLTPEERAQVFPILYRLTAREGAGSADAVVARAFSDVLPELVQPSPRR